jgi:hypothetical protein
VEPPLRASRPENRTSRVRSVGYMRGTRDVPRGAIPSHRVTSIVPFLHAPHVPDERNPERPTKGASESMATNLHRPARFHA